MSTTPETTAAASAGPRWQQLLIEKRARMAGCLGGIAVLFLILAIAMEARGISLAESTESGVTRVVRGDLEAVAIWAGLTGLVVAIAASWLYLHEPVAESEPDRVRFFVMLLGGSIGFLTALWLGPALLKVWWPHISGGWKVYRGSEGWRIWVVFLVILAGLTLIFVSMQAGRASEHSNPLHRKLLHASHAVFTAQMLFAVLLFLNLLVFTDWGPFTYVNREYPWADMKIYSLSSQAESYLKNLDKDTRISVIMATNDKFYYPMRALIDNCRQFVKPDIKFEVEYLSPDRDKERVARLAEDYKFAARSGVLILYGGEPTPESRFIKYEELVVSISAGRAPTQVFKGEDALISQLKSLQEGKEKPILYFTQGQGELDLAFTGADKIDVGAGSLKRNLETGNFMVKGLLLSSVPIQPPNSWTVVAEQVPEDASVVIIAGPKQKFSKLALTALKNYMEPTDPKKKKGKLIVLLDAILEGGKMVKTDLEPFLEHFGVQAGEYRLLNAQEIYLHDPLWLPVTVPPALRGRSVLSALFERNQLAFYNVRPVRPAQAGPRGRRYQSQPFLFGGNGNFAFEDTEGSSEPSRYVANLGREGLAKKLKADPIPIAVQVTDAPPREAANKEGTPRMIVVGDASFLCNQALELKGYGTVYYGVFTSMLSWLREKPALLGIPPNQSEVFLLNNPSPSIAARIVLLPGALTVVIILGMGAGMWIVRRR